MTKTLVKIIKSYWEMDIKPFLKVMLKTTTSKRRIKKQWEDDEDVEVYGKQHKHWDDWEMSEMPYVESNTSRDRDTLREKE